MASPGESRHGVARDAVVRSFARAVDRPCARPSCTAPANATLTFQYGTREAVMEQLAETRDPQAYDLCVTHAARTRPPEGWQLRDRRPEDERRPVEPHTTPVDLGGDRTVAVLAAALRSVPDPVSEGAIADPAEVDRTVALAEPTGPVVEPISPERLTLDLGPDLEPGPDRDEGRAGAAPSAPRPPLVVRDRAAAIDGSAESASDW